MRRVPVLDAAFPTSDIGATVDAVTVPVVAGELDFAVIAVGVAACATALAIGHLGLQ